MILSIIIPVYNVEKYIVGCLESIYSQGLDESRFEVIIVNDGTKDYSIEKIQSIIEQKDNCTLINQENQGLSVARNTGLQNAKGKYVWFVDSDDQVAPEVLNSILDLLDNRKEDIVAFNVLERDELTCKDKKAKPFAIKSPNCVFDRSYSGEQTLGMFHKGLVQRYIIRRAFLINKELYFFPGVWYEDDQLLVRLFCFIKDIYVSSIISYIYLLRQNGSIMSTVSIRTVIDSYKLICSWELFLKENHINKAKRNWVNFNIYRYYKYILSLKEQKIDGYETYMKGKWHKAKFSLLFSALKSGRFLNFKSFVRAMFSLFLPKLFQSVMR